MPDLHETINQFLEGSIASIGRDPVIESKSITANGTYTAPEGVDGYSPVVVNVSSDEPVIESKTITENGTYTPESGVDGFAPVVVNVQSTAPVIESKNITENGTYTAPEGVDGYSPVIVNVPIPQNAYLLKSVANLPQAIASFNDGADMVMPSLKVAIEPQQEGSGDPSPTNVRPISGWDETVVRRCGRNLYAKANNIIITKPIPNGTKVYTQIFGGTFAGASLYGKSNTTDWISLGTLSQSKNVITINRNDIIELKISTSAYSDLIRGNSDLMVSFTDFDDFEPYNGHTYTIDLDGTRYGVDLDVINGIGREYKEYPSYNGETLIGPWISDRDAYAEGTTPTIGAQVVDKGDISTFNTIPTAVKSLRGVNNVYANTGDIKDAEYFSKEV